MPFPSDEVLMKTAGDVVAQFQAIFGSHPGFRPAHAKGEILTGTFTPSAEAKALSSGPHFSKTVPIWVRFSNSTGIPKIPDNDSNAGPRGIAIRFQLGERKHTDIIAHSTPFFPTRTGLEFLQFLQALAAGKVEEFLGAHPKALAFVQAPKPAPESWATEQYWGVSAFKLVDAEGKGTFVRYQVVPTVGVKTLSVEEAKEKDADYLSKDLSARLAAGPIGFKILAQIAEDSDVTDDATIHWPDERKVVELGTLELKEILAENAKEQKHVIFDPIPRVEGVEPSADPLLEMRAAVYLISGKQRRAA